MTPHLNDPSVVVAVRSSFERYEQALVSDDWAVMTELFLDGPEVVRFGISDAQYGSEELALWRAAQPPHRPGRELIEVGIATYGDSLAVVTTSFAYPGRSLLGRQSQTWVRFDSGWRIVHAHVSEIAM